MKVIVTFEDGTIRVFVAVNRIESSSYNDVITIVANGEYTDLLDVVKIEAFI